MMSAYHLVSVNASQRPLVYSRRGASETLIQTESGCLLRAHAGELFLHTFEDSDCRGVGLDHYVKLLGKLLLNNARLLRKKLDRLWKEYSPQISHLHSDKYIPRIESCAKSRR